MQNFVPAHQAVIDAFEAHDETMGERMMLSHLNAVMTDLLASKSYKAPGDPDGTATEKR